MSKYIRTKNGIYEVIEECFRPMENNMVSTPQEGITKILKQSNSIGELCDGYYVDKNKETFIEDEVYEKPSKDVSEWLKQYFISCVEKGIDIYAFIKTNKGLIYVAKLNEKGELELL